MLGKLLRNLGAPATEPPAVLRAASAARAVLNVGGNSKRIAIPGHYDGWDHLLLDIDPNGDADIVCDARELSGLPAAQFDAVYCSHNLEHYLDHQVPRVLGGFLHVLKDDGFAEIRVPDLPAVFRAMLDRGMDLTDVLYTSPGGPIRILDVIYGWSLEIARSGNDFFAHKTGFGAKSLAEALHAAGFGEVWNVPPLAAYEVRAIGFKTRSDRDQRLRLGIPADDPREPG